MAWKLKFCIMKNITIIEKEKLPTIRFSKEEVIPEKAAQINRSINLFRAMLLGNIEHCKVNIIFKDQDDILHKVETTIWSVSEDYISLKGGKNIPIKAITAIEF